MRNLVKHVMFGALLCATVAGAMTISARRAEAAECDECTPDGGDASSGYLIATGNGNNEICVAADDPRAAGCHGGS